MKYALVNPENEVLLVVAKPKDRFDVAPPLAWVACPNEAVPDRWVRVGNEIVPYTPDMTLLKKVKLAQLHRAMESAIEAPVVVGGDTFRAKSVHRARIERLLDRGAKGKPLPAKIKTKDGTQVNLTPARLNNIHDAMTDQLDAAHERYTDVEVLVDAATTEAELDAITWAVAG